MDACRQGQQGGASDRKNRFLMIVDYDANDLFSNAMLFQRFGYNICTARTAEEAFDMAGVAVPALIVAATELPGIGLVGLLKKLRGNPPTASVPVIAMSSSGSPVLRTHCIEAGASECVAKPINIEEMYRAVQAAVEATPRENIRIRVRFPIVVNGEALDCGGGDCVSTLSERGMYIRTRKPLHVNERVNLLFVLAGRTIRISAVVLYSDPRGEGPYHEPGMGLKFTTISAEDQAFLHDHIHAEVAGGIDRRRE